MLHILARMTYYIEEQSGINSNFADYVNREQKTHMILNIWADDYNQGNHQKDFATEEEFKQFRNMFGGLLFFKG